MPSPRQSSRVWGGILVLVTLAMLFVGCFNQREGASVAPVPISLPAPSSPSASEPSISFEVDSADLGKVPLGKEVTYTFRFSNIGRGPLVVEGTRIEALEGC